MPAHTAQERSASFAERDGDRYWWHRLQGSDYVPPLYSFLSDDEWDVMQAWFEETDDIGAAGEANIPFMSFIQGFVMGNMIQRVVQLGTFAGYSTLLLGFMQRHMRVEQGLITIDISEEKNDFTSGFLDRAGLSDQVKVCTSDSSEPHLVEVANDWLGGPPQLVIIDSSHQYAHTLRELDLWFPKLSSGGLVVLHDCSKFAETFDYTGEGGVHRALSDWAAEHGGKFEHMTLCHRPHGQDPATQAYKDPCGLGLLQKL